MIDYSKNIIKEYPYWTVYVHTNQEYLGRCVIWCNREGVQDLTELTGEEVQEFFEIIKTLKIALERTFSPDWMNYSFLGNSTKHLHCHLVPRYKQKKEFMGILFEDKRWWSNWLLDDTFITPENILLAIKEKIQGNL